MSSSRGDEARAVTLDGRVERPPRASEPGTSRPSSAPIALPADATLRFALGEPHYRRSEESWADAGHPRAEVRVAHDRGGLRVEVDVAAPRPTFVPAGRENPLDNDPADVNGDGVQLYLRTDAGVGAWRLVPETGTARVRVSAASQHATALTPEACWAPTADGYRLEVRLPLAALRGAPGLDVVVNDVDPGRERRRGQLVLSGGAGEFVYLRGDRQPPERYLTLAVADV